MEQWSRRRGGVVFIYIYIDILYNIYIFRSIYIYMLCIYIYVMYIYIYVRWSMCYQFVLFILNFLCRRICQNDDIIQTLRVKSTFKTLGTCWMKIMTFLRTLVLFLPIAL